MPWIFPNLKSNNQRKFHICTNCNFLLISQTSNLVDVCVQLFFQNQVAIKINVNFNPDKKYFINNWRRNSYIETLYSCNKIIKRYRNQSFIKRLLYFQTFSDLFITLQNGNTDFILHGNGQLFVY